MKLSKTLIAIAAVTALAWSIPASADGLAKCDSGPKSGWKPAAELSKDLTSKKWSVKRVKEEDGCYEVYGKNAEGKRGEFIFHPVTFAPVAAKTK